MLKIINTRRIAQTFFFLLFIWFCVVATLGESWWQLRGWPINWFLELDPLVGLGVLLATHTLYAGLLWSVVTLVLTLILGRFFCGWVCPMGTLQQLVGYLGLKGRKSAIQISSRQPHKAQLLKYWFLFFLLSSAAADFLGYLFGAGARNPSLYLFLAIDFCILLWVLRSFKVLSVKPSTIIMVGVVIIIGGLWHWQFPRTHWLSASLQDNLYPTHTMPL